MFSQSLCLDMSCLPLLRSQRGRRSILSVVGPCSSALPLEIEKVQGPGRRQGTGWSHKAEIPTGSPMPCMIQPNFTHEVGCAPRGPILKCTPLGQEYVLSICHSQYWIPGLTALLRSHPGWIHLYPWGNYGRCFVPAVVYGPVLHGDLPI